LAQPISAAHLNFRENDRVSDGENKPLIRPYTPVRPRERRYFLAWYLVTAPALIILACLGQVTALEVAVPIWTVAIFIYGRVLMRRIKAHREAREQMEGGPRTAAPRPTQRRPRPSFRSTRHWAE